MNLDNSGLGPSGLMTKLRRLSKAIKYVSAIDAVTEKEVVEKARSVEDMIYQLCISVSKGKNLKPMSMKSTQIL